MKYETQQMLAKVASHLHEDKELYDKFNEFVKSVKRTEKPLTEGGYMQDSNGTLIKSGDFISFLVDNHAPECDRGVVYAQIKFYNGRFHLSNGNPLMERAVAGIWDMADLYDAGFKFFKVEENDFDEEPIWATVNGERRLLKPVIIKDNDGEKHIEMNDDSSNFYKLNEVDWTNSSFS